MINIKHVIFDLDHTLWDFEKNSNHVLKQLFAKHKLDSLLNTDFTKYSQKYHKVTNQLWKLYDNKSISKEELRNSRIPLVFKFFRYKNPTLAQSLEKEYLDTCPDQPNVFNGTHELLEYLSSKYELHILTNGFEKIQHRKLKASGIKKYFNEVITSECSGYSKPHKEAFDYLLNKINSKPESCIMIGDNPVSDIEGSKSVGIKNIHFSPTGNYSKKADFGVKSLLDIKDLI